MKKLMKIIGILLVGSMMVSAAGDVHEYPGIPAKNKKSLDEVRLKKLKAKIESEKAKRMLRMKKLKAQMKAKGITPAEDVHEYSSIPAKNKKSLDEVRLKKLEAKIESEKVKRKLRMKKLKARMKAKGINRDRLEDIKISKEK